MQALDAAAQFNPGAVQAAVNMGITGIIRYVHRNGGMTRAEADMIMANGADPCSVYETSGQSGMGGYQRGVDEANWAADGHLGAGGPQSVVVWTGAFDFDCRDPGGAQPYIDGYTNTMHQRGLLSGIYGPWGLGQNTHNYDAWWQTMSTGFWNNGPTSACTLTQHFPYVYPGGIECDQDRINDQTKWGGWRTSGGVLPADRSKLALLLGGL